jgi:hypothetical protein
VSRSLPVCASRTIGPRHNRPALLRQRRLNHQARPGVENPRTLRAKRLTLAYFSAEAVAIYQVLPNGQAFRPLASTASMNSRNGSRALADRVGAGTRVLSGGLFAYPGPVDTLMAGFWMGTSPTSWRSHGNSSSFSIGRVPFRAKCVRTRSIRLRDQPSRPSARTCCSSFAQDIHRRRINTLPVKDTGTSRNVMSPERHRPRFLKQR